MKRGAEKQLSKDDCSDGEDQVEFPSVGFKKAEDSVLATRKIRGLPKRASVAAIPTPTTEAPSNKFGVFSGFNGSSNSFSGFSTANPTFTNSSTNPFTPSTNTQTNTAKSLTSLLSSHNPSTPALSSLDSDSASTSVSTFTPTTTSVPAPTPVSTTPSTKDINPAELKYYTSLRGLNESLRTAVAKAVDEDAFVDITLFLERYKSLRADIQKTYDDTKPMSPSAPNQVGSTPAVKTFTMPSVPKEGFTFGGMKVPSSSEAKSSTTSSNSGGFFPSSSSGGFNFPGASSNKPKSIDPEAPTTSLPFPFGSKSSSTTTASNTTTAASSLFGTKANEGSMELVPTSKKLIPTSGEQTSTSSALTPNTFASSLASSKQSPAINFGVGTSTSFPKIFTGSESAKFETKPPAFGSSSSIFSFTATKAEDTTNTAPATGGRFAGFTGFGKPATTSTSFSFTPSFTVPPSAPSSGHAPSTSRPTTSASDSNVGAAGPLSSSTDGTTTDDTSKKNNVEGFALSADNKHDQEGAGEEDEETMHSVKLKAYVMKDNQGTKSWVELGYGMLRIKKHKETASRRVLLRSSSTGQILMNFNLHSAFKPTQKNKNVTFLGHNAENISTTYTVKLQSQDQAAELAEAFDREIKAKEIS